MALARPARAERFLAAHAASRRAHVLELGLRALVGLAFLVAAPAMRFAPVFRLSGWVLLATTLVLALLPWRLHHDFAAWSVPIATRRMALVGCGALAAGGVLLAALLWPGGRPGA